MVDTVKATLVAFVLGWAVSAQAQAQNLPDPTRPPSNLMAAGEGVQTPTVAGNRVQSIMLPAGAKPRALVNGEWLEPGQRVGGVKVVRISADRVVIKGLQGRETLLLNPDVEIKSAQQPSDKTKNQGSKK